MGRMSSAIKTAQTPLTALEKGAIKRSARMSTYAVLQVVSCVLWAVVSLWITLWVALVVIPRLGIVVQDGLGVTSANASSVESFINYWAAPMAVITVVVSAGVVFVCMALWKGRTWLMRKVRAWVDRPVAGLDNEPESTSDTVETEAETKVSSQKRVSGQSKRRRNRSAAAK